MKKKKGKKKQIERDFTSPQVAANCRILEYFFDEGGRDYRIN